MLSYQGPLTKFNEKIGGKNADKVDGFYHDGSGNEYFIKKPQDKMELFTELLAGFILQEFIERNLVSPKYKSSLIFADAIQFTDGSYGLIQPKIAFTELYKVIGTGKTNNVDRDPIVEVFFGKRYYTGLIEDNEYAGLPLILMFSLLLGDYSVHSGNVVLLNQSNNAEKKFARIDWGSAFRHFANSEQTDNILKPHEYQGLFNYKGLTKGYFANYKKIPGLFPEIASKARSLQSKLENDSLDNIIASALRKIPHDLLDQQTLKKLAKYTFIPQLEKARFGKEANLQEISGIFASIFKKRLENIAKLEQSITTFKINNPYNPPITDILCSTKIEVTNPPLLFNKDDRKNCRQQAHQAIIDGDLDAFKKIIQEAIYIKTEIDADLIDNSPKSIHNYLDSPKDKRQFLETALKYKQQDFIDYLFSKGICFNNKQFHQYANTLNCPHKLASVEPLFEQLRILEKKGYDLHARGHISAAHQSFELIKNIKQEIKSYIDNSNDNALDSMKDRCKTLIDNSKGSLEKHRGLKQVLSNLGLAIIGVGVIYLAAASVNLIRTKGKHFFFQFETDSVEKLESMNQVINSF